MEPIIIDALSLNRGAAAVREEVNSLRRQADSLLGAVEELNGMWRGSAQAAFTAAFSEDAAWLREQLRLLGGFADLMEQAGQEYGRWDESVRGIVNGIII